MTWQVPFNPSRFARSIFQQTAKSTDSRRTKLFLKFVLKRSSTALVHSTINTFCVRTKHLYSLTHERWTLYGTSVRSVECGDGKLCRQAAHLSLTVALALALAFSCLHHNWNRYGNSKPWPSHRLEKYISHLYKIRFAIEWWNIHDTDGWHKPDPVEINY